MRTASPLCAATVACLLLSCVGCSSLGLSCFPTGHYLTKQTETVLNQSPRKPQVPRELDQGVMPNHYMQPGDVLLIEPVDLESEVRLPADQQVLVDGSIDLGRFGRLVVAGLTIEQTETQIEQTILKAGQEQTQVNVRLLEPVHRYYVLGEVSSPGSYPLKGHESVLDGILTAGGLTGAAAPCKILLARPTLPGSCRVTLPVCYREITQLGDTTTNYQLQAGDRIFVASRSWCEELKFWQASKTCSRCLDCQRACADPAVIDQTNPVTQLPLPLAPPPLATEQVDQRDSVESDRTPSPSDNPDAPLQIPDTLDGELNFAPADGAQRFQPIWITSAEDPATQR